MPKIELILLCVRQYTQSDTMASKIINGENIGYSCIVIDADRYYEAIIDIDPSIYGFVVNGILRPADDVSLKCRNDWCLPVVESYNHEYWAIINRHPGELYCPYLTGEGSYHVVKYDIWRSRVGLVAVVTEASHD